MPIMDGLEACVHIYKYLNESGNALPIDQPIGYRHWSMRRSKTLLFCLSADISSARRNIVWAHPFDNSFSSLEPGEMHKIFDELKLQNDRIPLGGKKSNEKKQGSMEE